MNLSKRFRLIMTVFLLGTAVMGSTIPGGAYAEEINQENDSLSTESCGNIVLNRESDSASTESVESAISNQDSTSVETDVDANNDENYAPVLEDESPVKDGFVEENGQTVYYVSGEKSELTDVIKVDGKWYNLVNGVLTPDTVAKNANGWWYIDGNGTVNFKYSGFADNAYGTWYIQSGKVNFSAGGVLKGLYGGVNKWGNVSGGKLQKKETVAGNSYGWWYIAPNGFVDFNATTIAKNSYGWWYIKKGKVDFNYTGVARNNYGWFRIEGGKVNFSFKGLASNQYGTWYISGGKVNFSYSGNYSFNGVNYKLSKGKVIYGNDPIASLTTAKTATQIITVGMNNTTPANGVLELHTKDANGIWIKNLYTSCVGGSNGIGKVKQGDCKTPSGKYTITGAMGIKSSPGCSAYNYLKVDNSHYWIGDSASPYYNRLISTRTVTTSLKDAEHLIAYGSYYNYIITYDYNANCTPGKGSALFLHCGGDSGTHGCVEMPEQYMIALIRQLKPQCKLIIDYKSNINSSRY